MGKEKLGLSGEAVYKTPGDPSSYVRMELEGWLELEPRGYHWSSGVELPSCRPGQLSPQMEEQIL